VQLKTSINPLLLAIPALFDCTASTLMNIALTMVAASVYQMLRGMIIIITAGMSILFLKRKLYRHHWSSMAFIFIGVLLVGVAYATKPKKPDQPEQETHVLGLVMLVVAQFFAASLLIVEEKLLGNYYLDPLKVVGLEGLWGLVIWCILLPIFQQIQCTGELCPYGRLEDSMQAFRDYD
jgi:drug/metabolite transporter (DMT)-like permease